MMKASMFLMLLGLKTVWCLSVENFTTISEFRKGSSVSLVWLFHKDEDETVFGLKLSVNSKEIFTNYKFTDEGTAIQRQQNLSHDVKEQSYFNLTIPSLNYGFENNFSLHVVHTNGVGETGKIFQDWSRLSITDIKGDPEWCNGTIPPTLSFPESGKTLNMFVCGKPQPIVTWKFAGQSNKTSGVLVNETQHMYWYSITPELDRQFCGENMELSIEGLSTINKTSTVLTLFKPRTPEVISAKFTSENHTTITLLNENIGRCTCNYTVMFVNRNGSNVGIWTFETNSYLSSDNVRQKYSSVTIKSHIREATFVRVQSSFIGVSSNFTEAIKIENFMTTPATTTTTTPSTPTTTTTTPTMTTSTMTEMINGGGYSKTSISTTMSDITQKNSSKVDGSDVYGTKLVNRPIGVTGIIIIVSAVIVFLIALLLFVFIFKRVYVEGGSYAARKEHDKNFQSDDEEATPDDSPFNYYTEDFHNANRSNRSNPIPLRYESIYNQQRREHPKSERDKMFHKHSMESGFGEEEENGHTPMTLV